MTARAPRAHVLGIIGVTALLNACGGGVPAGPPGSDLRRGTGGETTAVGGNGWGGGRADGGSQGRGTGGVTGGPAGNGGEAGGKMGGEEGAPCGGFVANAQPCAAGLFCDLACAEDAVGTCRPKPQACDAIYAPVCGCDRRTYGNDCERQLAGVSKQFDGSCTLGEGGSGAGGGAGSPGGGGQGGAKASGGAGGGGRGDGSGGGRGEGGRRGGHEGRVGDACGGNTADARTCANGLFCDGSFPELACAADVGGICREIPNSCTRENNPVCGCDCKTYSNDCTRREAGVSKRAEGECATVKGC